MAGKKPSSGLFQENGPYNLEEFQAEFLSQGDASGYLVAQKLLTEVPHSERWQEWRRIFRNPPMSNILKEWQEELAALTMAILERQARKGHVDPKDWPRARWILEGNLDGMAKKKVGRPSKEKVEKREAVTRRAANMDDRELDNIIRLKDRE